MADLAFVIRKINAGAKVRIVHDRYGQERVQVARGWFPIPARVELSREEMQQVKAALSARNRSNRQTVSVT